MSRIQVIVDASTLRWAEEALVAAGATIAEVVGIEGGFRLEVLVPV